LSAQAAALEAAGKAVDMPFIQENLSVFAGCLSELIKNILVSLEQNIPHSPAHAPYSPLPTPHSLLFKELFEALQSQKVPEIKRILKTLGQQTQDSKLKEILEQISDQVFMTEFESAAKLVEELLAEGN
jgi:hypothetical protein